MADSKAPRPRGVLLLLRGKHWQSCRTVHQPPGRLLQALQSVSLDPVHQRVVEGALSAHDAQIGGVRSNCRCGGTAVGLAAQRGAHAGRWGWQLTAARRQWRPGLEVNDAMLAPLVLLHRLLTVELLLADVAFEGPVVPVGALVNLQKQKSRHQFLIYVTNSYRKEILW